MSQTCRGVNTPSIRVQVADEAVGPADGQQQARHRPHIPQRGVVGIEKTESQNIKATGSPVTKQHSAGMIPTQFPGATPHQLRCIHGERTLKSLEAPSHENISHARQFQGEWMTPPADAAKASGGRARPGNRCHPWSRQVLVGPRAVGNLLHRFGPTTQHTQGLSESCPYSRNILQHSTVRRGADQMGHACPCSPSVSPLPDTSARFAQLCKQIIVVRKAYVLQVDGSDWCYFLSRKRSQRNVHGSRKKCAGMGLYLIDPRGILLTQEG
jgi:hypothetical protein